MFSDKENVNILTSLLIDHGVNTAVLCPGSRNAPICHNLVEAVFDCHSVVDERSAGFYAIGMSLALHRPVVVCVTSGSAVLNLSPAVAEAYYRHIPLIIVSADRPADRIGQLVAQTIDQDGVLDRFCKVSVTLPEPHDPASRAYCNRLVNEALIEAGDNVCPGPVHINVPITEPLYNFDRPSLPSERVIRRFAKIDTTALANEVFDRLNQSSRPMIVVGQLDAPYDNDSYGTKTLERRYATLYESLSGYYGGQPIDRAIDSISHSAQQTQYYPDFVLYVGGTTVSRKIISLIANSGAEVWSVSPDGQVHDTFGNLTRVISAPTTILADLARIVNENADFYPIVSEFSKKWHTLLQIQPDKPSDSLLGTAIRLFEQEVSPTDGTCTVHYANSSVIRQGNIYSDHYNYVNRGVNGIEGSLSTACGFSLVSKKLTYCVIGDLSFFYDSNALWNSELGGNLRILLVNDGCGGIFSTLSGATDSPAYDRYISAHHNTSAEHICRAYDIVYLRAENLDDYVTSLHALIHSESQRPMLLELMIDNNKNITNHGT